ncbi:MAG: ROK family protein, partial [Gemmatimonadetes bacterium]|nr:ROK family protein [Gemmatimonadota bacterium]
MPSQGPPFVLAADIGGTSMRAALFDRAGTGRGRGSCPTEPARGILDAADRLAALLQAARAAAGGAPIAGVGLSTAGPIDPHTGVYDHPPNLTRWHGQTMKPALERALGLPVWINRDGNLAALAESRFGPHAGAQNLLYVTVSTGIGGGIIANGRMATGARGGAGEVGHITVLPGGPSCGAGCDGCVEAVASGTALAARARERIEQGAPSAMLAMAGGDPRALTSPMVFEAVAAGDPLAADVLDTGIRYLGIALGALLNTFDPEVLVLGGAVAHALKPHWDRLLSAVEAHCLPRYAGAVPITLTTLGDDVSLLGASAY